MINNQRNIIHYHWAVNSCLKQAASATNLWPLLTCFVLSFSWCKIYFKLAAKKVYKRKCDPALYRYTKWSNITWKGSLCSYGFIPYSTFGPVISHQINFPLTMKNPNHPVCNSEVVYSGNEAEKLPQLSGLGLWLWML